METVPHPRHSAATIEQLDLMCERTDWHAFLARHLLHLSRIYDAQGEGGLAHEYQRQAQERIDKHSIHPDSL